MTPEQLRGFAETILATITKTEKEQGLSYEITEDGRYMGLMEAYELAIAYIDEHPLQCDDFVWDTVTGSWRLTDSP